jgi:pimeloyl-ACP methyl ester carboxylesterase
MHYAYRITLLLCLCVGITANSGAKQNTDFYNERTKNMNYSEEEVSYQNKTANVTLSGTLTMPQAEGPFPVALLISGMGPNDRDYDTCGHKLFLTLADHLTNRGIAVLRVDKRGVGKSTGTLDATVTSKDLAGDVLAGVEYLKSRKDINHDQIGLIGHSEGGMIAMMVAAQSKDVAFVVSMAGATATSVDDVMESTALQLRADGAGETMVAQDRKLRAKVLAIVMQEQNSDVAAKLMHEVFATYWAELPETLKQESGKLLFAFTQANADAMITMFNSPWYRFFFSYQPVDTLKQIKAPVLAINGTLDWIALSKTLSVIAKALEQSGNRDYTTVELPNLNHQFRTCKTGSLAEYMAGGAAMAPEALNVISDWILERTINKKQ